MVSQLLKKVFGSRNDRVIKRLYKMVAHINSLEPNLAALSDEALQQQTLVLRQRLAHGSSLSDLLPEAFATVREAGKRVMGMRHFDEQLIGGMVLHDGKIAEMRTGEGKTLVATLAAYLNALPGKGVHVVTVNDYLARRDSEWMGQLYQFLGLSVGVIVSGISHAQRQAAYAADITYGTNNEFGFDYLRDNMAFALEDRVQRPPYFAIVDEVDSILIDEARTPLIISGAAEDSSELYLRINQLIPFLSQQTEENGPGDYSLDEKVKQVYLTEAGHQQIEALLIRFNLLKPNDSLYDPQHIALMHHINAALRAHKLFTRDVDYIIKENSVVIVDEFTGRSMEGRRWSDGLHQAVEAKEGVAIQHENHTLASITFQNYFRLYPKLSGMTGTADTEAFEFQQIYGLEVTVIPTHRNMIRQDRADLIYLSKEEKFEAIIADIKTCRERHQPVLVGTTSIETSELMARLLQKEGIPHQVLNAKHHAKEAEIIAQAGLPGAVTIATNMAGRGTDIVLGGNVNAELKALGENASEAERDALKAAWTVRHDAVLASGGLHIIGTERHESRRIDNQLRGRAGRQGDPGSSRFYLAMDDNLMRIFASERVTNMMRSLGMERGEAIEHQWVTKAIENAQRKVEGHNFDIRKNLLEYDNVANDQRREIYAWRSELMASTDISTRIKAIRRDVINQTIDEYMPPQSLEEQWNIPGLEEALNNQYSLVLEIRQWLAQDAGLHEATLRQKILETLEHFIAQKEAAIGPEVMRQIEKGLLLQLVDNHWKEHLAAMDYLRQGIHLRGYAQKNPKQEYKREALEMFAEMLENIKHEIVAMLSRVQVRPDAVIEPFEAQKPKPLKMNFEHASAPGLGEVDEPEAEIKDKPYVRQQPKVGRNDPCPCGSGKKYKQCHGVLK